MPFFAIFSFIRTHWIVIVAGLAIIALIGYITNLRMTVTSQRAEISELTTKNTILEANVATLKQSITTQNASIEKFADQAKDVQQRFATLNTTINKQTATLGSKIQAITIEAKPTTCDETIQYLIAAIQGYKP
jgi:chromosome segregation ATPase